MKRANLLLVLLLVGLIGCTYNSLPDDMATPVAVSEQGFDLTFSTRAEAFDGVELDSEYFVAEHDLESYLNYKQKHSGKKINIKNYSAYGFDNSHTLFYIINYDKGWEVVSADKRTQPTLAYGESGSFSMGADNTNEAEKFWMEMLASDVLQKRQRNKSQSTRSDDAVAKIANNEEQARVNYWNRICTNGTRVIEVGSISDLSSPNTVYYVLGSTTSDTTLIDKGPYLKTKWGQGWPWNKKCLPCSSHPNKTSLVGCVAVAGGQLLYYLADEKNWWLPIPSNVSLSGQAPLNYEVIASGFTNQMWGAMALDIHGETWEGGPCDLVATLLTWIGGNVGMSYRCNNRECGGSSANTLQMMIFLNSQFGISYDRTTSYNIGVIRNELRDDTEPILLRGTNVNEGGGGHAWLMDGYKLDVITDSVYYIVSDTAISSDELAQMDINDATHVIRYELEDEYVRMNWGWDGSQDGFYGIMSNNWTPDEYKFSSSINLYYNFTNN